MVMSTGAARRPVIPRIIKRNTFLLAATQAFVGIGTQMGPTLGAIIVTQMLGAATLAGLSTSIASLSRFLVAYPIGWVADTCGRRVATLIGLSLALVGAVGIGQSVIQGSLPLFVGSMLVFGLGVGAGQQLRLAAADLYPPAHAGRGAGLRPVRLADRRAGRTGVDQRGPGRLRRGSASTQSPWPGCWCPRC